MSSTIFSLPRADRRRLDKAIRSVYTAKNSIHQAGAAERLATAIRLHGISQVDFESYIKSSMRLVK